MSPAARYLPSELIAIDRNPCVLRTGSTNSRSNIPELTALRFEKNSESGTNAITSDSSREEKLLTWMLGVLNVHDS